LGVIERVEVPRDFIFVDFKVKREQWNKYKLEDGSILKTKFVLINVLMEKDFEEKIKTARAKKEKVKLGFGIQSKNVVGVEVPPKLRGEPSTERYSSDELRASVVEEDVEVIEVITQRWNVYDLANGVFEMKVRNSPINVSRTNKFDVYGIPIYLVDSTADIKIRAIKS